MFIAKLNQKHYLFMLVIFFLTACGSTTSNNSYMATGDEKSSFGSLSKTEKEALTALNLNQKKLLDAINFERSQSQICGDKGTFPPVLALTWNAKLQAAAHEHVYDLAYSDTFAHNGSGTKYDITGKGQPSKFYERIIANGYKNYYSVGENIAGGQKTIEEVMKAWMKSPGHCENIMKNTYTQVGVSIVMKSDSSYQVYWGQNFGSKRI